MSSKITPAIRASLEAAVGAAQVISDAERTVDYGHDEFSLREIACLPEASSSCRDRPGRSRPSCASPTRRIPVTPRGGGDGPLRRLRSRRRAGSCSRSSGSTASSRSTPTTRWPWPRPASASRDFTRAVEERGALFPAAPRRRERHDGRPDRDQRRRRPGRQVRDDPQLCPRPRGRPGRRRDPHLGGKLDQDEHRLQPAAPVHRLRGDARHRHQGR